MNTSITDRPIATRLLNRGLGQHFTRTGVVGIYGKRSMNLTFKALT
ncbi:hypothetical protein [Pseudomonas monteilii]|nr:hypothetical protein [Pseudomonas monteilii]MBF8748849.1 hypothetical protein [Pseudomonas monteilii]